MIEMSKPLSQFTEVELKDLMDCAERELNVRKAARRDELIQAVCDTMNLLHKEFPSVELRMGYQCPECAMDDDVDMMEYFCGGKKMNPKDFYVW